MDKVDELDYDINEEINELAIDKDENTKTDHDPDHDNKSVVNYDSHNVEILVVDDISMDGCSSKLTDKQQSSDIAFETDDKTDLSIPIKANHTTNYVHDLSTPGTSSTGSKAASRVSSIDDLAGGTISDDFKTPPGRLKKKKMVMMVFEKDHNRVAYGSRKLVTRNFEQIFDEFKVPDKGTKTHNNKCKLKRFMKHKTTSEDNLENPGASGGKSSFEYLEHFDEIQSGSSKSSDSSKLDVLYLCEHDTEEEDEEEAIEDDTACTCISNSQDSDDDCNTSDDYQDFESNFEKGIQHLSARKRKIDDTHTGDSKRRLLSETDENGIANRSSTSDLVSSPIVESTHIDFPDLNKWLTEFHSWSNSERLRAIDALISECASDQVRHMRESIEPLFQRDFISLLPRELALTVLGFLDAPDLFRAAQTCRYWRVLADDNLIWKEQCQKSGIYQIRRRTMSMPACPSPWKVTFMQQHIIDNNWCNRPIRRAKILKGHDDHVITCLQFYGNKILSGSDDTTLKLWSAVTGKCLRTLVGHTGGVWSSHMVGQIIVSGSTDRTLRVWDAKTGECLKVLSGHVSTVRCMHLHEDRVVSGSRDTRLRVWSITTGKCLQVLVGHLAAVRCVQFNGKYVVSGAYDYNVKVWNPETGECLHTLTGHTNRVYSLQFDGVHVVSGSLDTSIRVWDVESGALKHTLMGHQSLTSGMDLRSNILVSGNADSTVKIWDIMSGKCLHTLAGPDKHQSAVTCVQSNQHFVITSSDDGTVKLWDLRTGKFIRNLISLSSGGSGGVVWRIRSSSTKLVCAVGSRNGTEETKLMVLDFDVPGACQKCCD